MSNSESQACTGVRKSPKEAETWLTLVLAPYSCRDGVISRVKGREECHLEKHLTRLRAEVGLYVSLGIHLPIKSGENTSQTPSSGFTSASRR